MSKKYFTPEEREKAEAFRRVKRIVALHHMTEHAILESMKKLVLPKSEGSALDEFFSEKTAGEIVDYNAGKGLKTLLIYVCAPDDKAPEIAIDMKDLGLVPIVPQLVWPTKFFGDSEEARKLQLKLRVGLMEYSRRLTSM